MIELHEHLEAIVPVRMTGTVNRLVGMTAAVAGLPAPLGSTCRMIIGADSFIDCEVIGFDGDETLVMPYCGSDGIHRGTQVELIRSNQTARAGYHLLGSVLNAFGAPIDDSSTSNRSHLPVRAAEQTWTGQRVNITAAPTPPLSRPVIEEVFSTGIRAIDALLTCGKGQRLGVFAGSGVGKSVLLGQIARSSLADVNIIVLVGERGREVREFVDRNLGPDGLSKSIVVSATSDESPLLRIRAAKMGAALAEYFRDQGENVLLLMDSVTRFAHAQREVGLAAGEPPTTRGFPPSVFSTLPQLLERSGRNQFGSITAFYTVLVEGDDPNEPIADAVRGILDGHVVLSRRLASARHWPALDIANSISRTMPQVISEPHQVAAQTLTRLISAYEESRELISIGAYQAGASSDTDRAIQLHSHINDFLQQPSSESAAFQETIRLLQDLIAE